jgi:23S rRNA (adenine2030-N6)-methyltransferase
VNTLCYENESLPYAYRHSHHAGNIGDVWKHLIWIALIRELQQQYSALSITDCHAGLGEYELKPTGEWCEGIGKIAAKGVEGAPALFQEYINLVEVLGFNSAPKRYPGSPRLCERLLRPSDSLRCYELVDEIHAGLQARFAQAGRIEIVHGDGLQALRNRCEQGRGEVRELFLLDPAWTAKRDWLELPAALIECHAVAPGAHIALWYPIKSYTRVNQMQRILREGKTPCVVLDLISTPLSHKRNRLNGSGVLLINPPDRVLQRIGEVAQVVGERGAILEREWEFRCLSF